MLTVISMPLLALIAPRIRSQLVDTTGWVFGSGAAARCAVAVFVPLASIHLLQTNFKFENENEKEKERSQMTCAREDKMERMKGEVRLTETTNNANSSH